MEQIRAACLPYPHAVIVPLGSGETAVGLVVGLVLEGLPTPVRAVVVVRPSWLTRVYNSVAARSKN
ncbi:hypothetical protein [Pajaroellobacter abortibovis]|uniref:Tryptophan synthase beta chain-like PALP domain-containing protein n=1 Tax=Pajaroellobacter abortibovis TaxID=1882918 RepID=A0A1L6MVH9_9BACT|nr:hypothetical protein [Pajaroellobacter abortibovis]APR99415.1 hypothetical protein BCY86_01005 [Pajaroellobacter abortibovis]